jgi:hypothetical protein
MKRFAALLLLMCCGCAADEDNLLWDSLFGDIRHAISPQTAVNPCVPTTDWYATMPSETKPKLPSSANQ